MKIKVLGSGREVGRAAIAVEYDGKAVLLDYGVNFDEKDNPVMPLHIPPNKIEALVLTHTHLDHIGAAPLLYATTRPRAFATRFTRIMSRLMLEDFLKLSGYYLDFESTEVDNLLQSIEDVRENDRIEVGDFTLEFMPNGHIPGSLAVKVSTPDGSVLYTSDVNNIDTKLVKGASLAGVEADVLIMESTYGNADHPPRYRVEKRFVEAVKEVLEKNGTILVPSFSVGRGQEIMCILAENEVTPVSVDGMIRKATEIMLDNKEFLRDPSLLEKAVKEQKLLRGWQDRRRVWREPGVIVASAGMLKGGPSRYYLRKIHGKEGNAIFLVSYQGPGTPGRMILEKGIFREGGPLVRARVEWFDFSSHAGSSGLVEIASSIKNLKQLYLVHGEPEAQSVLAERIKEKTGIVPRAPESGEVIEVRFP
jgi:putative mRNA 3-end processing factor